MIKASLAKFWDWGAPPPKGRAYYESLLPKMPFDEASPLPKAIYQTYYRKEVPERLAQNIELIKRLNPSYTYKLFDDDDIINFIKTHYGDAILSIYNKIIPRYGAARADLFRYLLIYKLGGVYLDIKSSLKYPLDEVLSAEDNAVLSHWDNLPGQEHEGWTTVHPGLEASPRGEYVQWYLIYKAGHPLLREIVIDTLQSIDRYNPFVNSVGRGGGIKYHRTSNIHKVHH